MFAWKCILAQIILKIYNSIQCNKICNFLESAGHRESPGDPAAHGHSPSWGTTDVGPSAQ